MGIKFAVEKAADGRYNYGTEASRALLKTLPTGFFATKEEAAEALTSAVQAAFDACLPKPKPCADGDCSLHRNLRGGCLVCGASSL
jgi:hypothetical protein